MKNAMFSFAGIRLLFKVIYVQYRKSDDGFDKNVIRKKWWQEAYSAIEKREKITIQK